MKNKMMAVKLDSLKNDAKLHKLSPEVRAEMKIYAERQSRAADYIISKELERANRLDKIVQRFFYGSLMVLGLISFVPFESFGQEGDGPYPYIVDECKINPETDKSYSLEKKCETFYLYMIWQEIKAIRESELITDQVILSLGKNFVSRFEKK